MADDSADADLRFAAAVVDVVRRRAIHAPELINTALDVAISYRHKATAGAAERGLLQEISNYLYWGVLDSDVAELIVPRVAAEVRQFVERTAGVALESLGGREQYRVDQVMVRILSNVPSRAPGARRQAQDALTNLYAIGRDSLLPWDLGTLFVTGKGRAADRSVESRERRLSRSTLIVDGQGVWVWAEAVVPTRGPL